MGRTRKIRVKLKDYPAPIELDATFVNPGEWFKKRWLVSVGIANVTLHYVVEGEHEQAVIINLTNSEEYGHIIRTDEICEFCEQIERLEDQSAD